MATPGKKDNGKIELTVTVTMTVTEMRALVRTTMTPTGPDEPPGTSNASRRAVAKLRAALRELLMRNNFRIDPPA